jgi:hypothetical protein
MGRVGLGLRGSVVLIPLAAVVWLASTSACAELPRESWYETRLGEARAGHGHEIVDVNEEGLIVTRFEYDLRVKRLGDLVRVAMSGRFEETEEGKPVGAQLTTELADEAIRLDIEVDGSRLLMRKSGLESEESSVVELDSELLFPQAVADLHVSRGFRPGDAYSFTSLDLDSEQVGHYSVRVLAPQTLEILGEARQLNKLVITVDLYPGVVFMEWRDGEGVLWRDEVPRLAMVRQRTTREVALSEEEAADIIATSLIPANVEIEKPLRVDSALYELWLRDEDVSELVVEDARQRIEGTTDRGVLLRVTRTVPEPGTTAEFPMKDTDLSEYLDDNTLIQSVHPRILGVAARSAWGSDQDAWKAARQAENWVYMSIEDKGFGTAFGSALEVLDKRSGDCTEHAILLAAMARALSIPSKLVSGVLYFHGQFAHHMWVEVWTGEEWYALDPTIGEGSVDATHIKLAESSVQGGNIAGLSLGIMRTLNQLSIEIVEYTSGGKTVRSSSGH